MAAGRQSAGALHDLAELAAPILPRCDFPVAGSAVDLAVSGGADSLALLALASAAGLVVTAFHVDHGLRPGSSQEGAVVVRAAERFGASSRLVRVELEDGPDLEARARKARYAALPAGVMTGHTADDVAETVLLNICWGAGIDGLAPMRARPGALPIRRPILNLRRSETRSLCQALGMQPVEDPSNQDQRFRRNRVRHRLVPLLADIAERDPVPVLARQAQFLADDAALLDKLAAELDPTDGAALAAAPVALARRAVRQWLRASSDFEHHPPSAAEVQRVLAVASGQVVACEVAGGRRVSRRRGRLEISGPGSVAGAE